MNSLYDVRYMTFDVVGTLIDFEAGLTDCLGAIGWEAGVAVDAETALVHYRAARHMREVGRFPDDLERVYSVVAPALGLPADPVLARRLRDSVPAWKPFPDSVGALAQLGRHARLIAMTNAQRWALEHFERALGMPFDASFTVDDTGTEKPDPAFFRKVMDAIEREGGSRAQLLHVAQSQYHDIGVTRTLGWTNCWIQRRHDREGYGGSIAPERFTEPDYHFTSLAGLADAMDQSRAA
jgi:putative hydrolase of the HAD superfamily